jgi:hypothetical protein
MVILQVILALVLLAQIIGPASSGDPFLLCFSDTIESNRIAGFDSGTRRHNFGNQSTFIPISFGFFARGSA